MIHHREYKKMEQLCNNQDSLIVAEFQTLFNKWDFKLIEHTHACEKLCTKFLNGTIEFSPVVSRHMDQ